MWRYSSTSTLISVGTVKRSQIGQPENLMRSLHGPDVCLFFQKGYTGSGAQTASNSISTESLYPWTKWPGIRMTTSLNMRLIMRIHMPGAHGGSVISSGRSRVRFLMVLLEFFIDIILPAPTMVLRSTQLLTEMSTRSISWG